MQRGVRRGKDRGKRQENVTNVGTSGLLVCSPSVPPHAFLFLEKRAVFLVYLGEIRKRNKAYIETSRHLPISQDLSLPQGCSCYRRLACLDNVDSVAICDLCCCLLCTGCRTSSH